MPRTLSLPQIERLRGQLQWLLGQCDELGQAIRESIDRLHKSAELLENPVHQPPWAGRRDDGEGGQPVE
jgi:hypothetical protein